MRVFCAASIAGLLAAGPVLAQDRMAQDQCDAVFDRLIDMASAAVRVDGQSVTADGWCEVTGIRFDAFGLTGTVIEIDLVRWRASDIDRFLDEGLPPRSLDLQTRGMRTIPQSGDPVYDYLIGLRLRQLSIGVDLSARWDGVQNSVFVDQGLIDLGFDNSIEMTARIDNMDLSDQASLQASTGALAVREITFETDFNGWFETYLSLPVGSALLSEDGGEPQEQVAALQSQTIDFIDGLPDASVPEPAKIALSAFVTALPTPRGNLQVQFNAEPGIGAARAVMAAGLGQDPNRMIEVLLDGVTILARWTPDEDTE